MNTYSLTVIISLNVLVCSRAFVLRTSDLYRLDVIHYNDFHVSFEETSVLYPVCTSNNASCIGGFARLYYEIKELLKEKPGALLLNAGDVFQGTYWYSLLKWNVTQRFINTLPHDAHALGNHEFDDGVEGLVPYLKAFQKNQGPVLAANIQVDASSPLHGLYSPHVVLERNGRKIGIIGLITTETAKSSKPGPSITFLDPIKVVRNEAQLLADRGVDIIIVLSHCGLAVDKEIARSAGDHIDVIVGGHSHSLLWNGEAPSKEQVLDPYPVVEQTNLGHKIVIVTASAYTKYLGNLTVYFDENGELVHHEGEPVFLNRSIPEDPEIKALMEPYSDYLHRTVNRILGSTRNKLALDDCGDGECRLGNLVVDSQVDAINQRYPSNYTTIGFMLKNMIRHSIPKGNITFGSVMNTLPFTNDLVTFVAPGKVVLEALEKTLKKNLFYYMPMISGVQMILNITSLEITSVLVQEGGQYKPLETEKNYRISILDFLYSGGSGYTMFKNYRKDFKVIGEYANILATYIEKVSPITPQLDKRLVVVK